MKNNETGEFELVLGNNQLVVGFLIVALLFGVAFAMGYIVGRNSTPSAKLQAENTTASGSKDARPQPASPEPAAQAPATTPPPPEQPPAPAAEPPAPAAQTPAEQTKEQATQPATQPARESAPAESPAPGAVAEAPPGSYWQVIATSNRVAAEGMVAGLKEKGLPVTLGPGPNNLVRVLVGPYGDAQSLGRAKTVLEGAGLHPVLKRE